MRDNGLTILQLHVENVRGAKKVTVCPKATGAVPVKGKNGAGKSSVLDAIQYALGGKAVQPQKPIRHGETAAQVVANIGGKFTVRRTWTAKQSYLTVERCAEPGSLPVPIPSPQAFLDELCGTGIGFDPLAFTGRKPADQVQMLLDVLSLPEDPRALDAKRKDLYDQRTLVNRQVKQAEGAVSQTPHYPDAPAAELSMADIMAEHQRLLAVRDANYQARRKLENAEAAQQRAATRVEQLKAALVEAEAELAEAAMVLQDARSITEALVDPDLTALTAQMHDVETINAKVRANQEHQRLAKAASAYQEQSAQLTDQIEALDKRKTDLLTSAAFPLPGLAIAEDGRGGYVVTYQDVPLADCASSEQLRVSMALALALNPTIRVVLLREGSLLDEEALAAVEEWAEANGVQCWIELATTASGGEGFTIEAGLVQEA